MRGTYPKEKKKLQNKCEIFFLLESITSNLAFYLTDLEGLLDQVVRKAMAQGKSKAKETYTQHIAWALMHGAGPILKMTAIGSAIPPLRLIFKEKKGEHINYVTDPRQFAARHTDQ